MRNPGRNLAAFLAALVLASAPAVAQTAAEAEREEDYIRVVQKQPFSHAGRFSLAPTFGFTFNDPLVTHLLLGVNINYFFTETIGIQLQFHKAFDTKLSGQNILLANQLRPEINPMEWVGSGGVEWIPAYGKFALFNGPIMYWDAYLSGGAGAVGTKRGGVTVAGAVAVGTRLFFTPWLTLVVEVRDYLYNETFTLTTGGERSNFVNNLVFSVGVSFFMGGGG